MASGPGRYMVPSLRIPDETSVEVAHLSTLAADVIEALPNSLTRSLSDLKELDAVLSGSLDGITDKLNRLLQLIYDEKASPQERLVLLKEVAEDVVAFKLGGEDKIRVATGTCETVLQHSAQLDMVASLLSSLMPPWMVANMSASSTPSGYPTLFPSFAAAANTATAHIARPRSDFFLPPGAHPSGSVAASYAQAAEQVNAYRAQGRLQPLKTQKSKSGTTGSNKRTAATEKRRHQDVYAPPDAQAKRRKQTAHTVDAADGVYGEREQNEPLYATSSYMGLSPDKQAKRRKPKVAEHSPDVSNATRQPRRRATQANYYADEDEEEASVGEDPNPDEEESADDRLPRSGELPRTTAVPAVPLAISHEEAPDEDDDELAAAALGAPEKTYCYCQGPSYGEMIGCDNADCLREWFHLDCLGLKTAPSGTWYCEECKTALGNHGRRAPRR